jgi:hypothetical protein
MPTPSNAALGETDEKTGFALRDPLILEAFSRRSIHNQNSTDLRCVIESIPAGERN